MHSKTKFINVCVHLWNNTGVSKSVIYMFPEEDKTKIQKEESQKLWTEKGRRRRESVITCIRNNVIFLVRKYDDSRGSGSRRNLLCIILIKYTC